VADRLAMLSLAGWIGTLSGCSALLDFDGYTVKRDAGDGGAGAPFGPAVASFDSYHFTRGAAVAFSVLAADGTLANDSGEDVRAVAATLTTQSGGQVELSEDGSFLYSPPGALATFWGDDYFEYALQSDPPARARVRLTLQPPALSLAELAAAGAGGFGVAGARAEDNLGAEPQSFAPAGDVNGDGFEDLVIGVMGFRMGAGVPFGPGRGAYVLFGKSDTRAVSLADLAAEKPRGFAIEGDDDEATIDSLGNVVAGAGDVNGDGLDDVIVGSPGFGINGAVSVSASFGAAYVVFGKADSSPVSTAAIRAGAGGGFFIQQAAPGFLVGFDVDGAGDVNGDGLDDVVVSCLALGSPVPGELGFGGARVVFGRVGNEPVLLNEIDAGNAQGFAIRPDRAEALGSYVAGLGDVNGDGLADVALGTAAGPGRVVVVFGKTEPTEVRVADLETAPSTGFVIAGADELDNAGSVTAGGDVDGDGLDDILVATPAASLGPAVTPPITPPIPARDDAGSNDAGDAGSVAEAPGPALAQPRQGVVYVVFGKREPGPVSLRALEDGEGHLGFAMGGTELGQELGTCATSGDIDGDGKRDIVVSEPATASAGHDYIVFGKSDTRPVMLSPFMASSDAAVVVLGPPAEATGAVTATGADVNGDGLDDLLVSAQRYANAPQAAGGAYVAFGWDMSRALDGRDRALIGGSRDDVFDLPREPIVIARGGHGTDTLRIGQAASVLDLTLLGRYESIEVIDVRGAGPNVVLLDETALRRIPQNHLGLAYGLARRLTVLGDAEDVLRFDLAGFTRRGGSAGRIVWGREGRYYGLEVSQALRVVAP
jgi:FG-GAP repeat/Bacterial Ig domain